MLDLKLLAKTCKHSEQPHGEKSMKYPEIEKLKALEEAKQASDIARAELYDKCDTWAEFRIQEAVQGTCPKHDLLDPFWWYYHMTESKKLRKIVRCINILGVVSLALLAALPFVPAWLKTLLSVFCVLVLSVVGVMMGIDSYTTSRVMKLQHLALDKRLNRPPPTSWASAVQRMASSVHASNPSSSTQPRLSALSNCSNASAVNCAAP